MEKNQEFITVINSLLLLVDYKPNLLNCIRSGERMEIKKAAISAARAANILNVPVVMTSIDDHSGGGFIKSVADIFPGKEIIRRSEHILNALEDENVSRNVRLYGRDKIVIAGLWTSEGMTGTALGAIEMGYDVFGLIDATGDTTIERHNYGIRRMLSAGVTPITWMSLTSEWMNGWAVPVGGDNSEEIFNKYNAMLSYLERE